MKKNHLLISIFSLIPFFLLSLVVIINMNNVPFYDQWNLIPLLKKYYDHSLTFSDFWQDFNGSRLLLPKIIWIIMGGFTHWDIRFEIILNMIIGAGIFHLLFLHVKKIFSYFKTDQWHLFIPVLSMLIFSFKQYENWLVGWQISLLSGIYLVLLGNYFLSIKFFKRRNYLSALIAGLAATYSFGCGLIFWGMGLLQLLFMKFEKGAARRNYIFIWLSVAFVAVIIYFRGLSSSGPGILYILKHMLNFIRYIFNFIGNPLSSAYQLLAGISGVVLFFVLLIYMFKVKKAEVNPIISFINIALFSLTSALMAAAGRVHFHVQQSLSSRYVSFALLFWFVVLALLFVVISNNRHLRERIYFLSVVLFFAIIISIQAESVKSLKSIREFSFALKEAEVLMVNNSDERCADFLYPYPSFSERLRILKNYKLSFFRERRNQNQ